MDRRAAVRFGGIIGLLAVVVMIPAYLVGSPDLPGSPEDASAYFEAGIGTFVFSNGVLPLFHVFFFILFLGVLYGVLRSAGDGAQGGGVGLPAAALAGGIVFVGLEAVGFAAEILYPADAVARSRSACGCPGGAVVDSGSLRTDAYRRCGVYWRSTQAYCTAVSPPNPLSISRTGSLESELYKNRWSAGRSVSENSSFSAAR